MLEIAFNQFDHNFCESTIYSDGPHPEYFNTISSLFITFIGLNQGWDFPFGLRSWKFCACRVQLHGWPSAATGRAWTGSSSSVWAYRSGC